MLDSSSLALVGARVGLFGPEPFFQRKLLNGDFERERSFFREVEEVSLALNLGADSPIE